MMSGNKELCRSNLEACTSELWVLMHTNLLKLNDSKTEFILTGTRNMLNMYGKMQITIGDDTINNVDSAKNLGVSFDKHLKNTIHINKLSSTLFYTIRNIDRVCRLQNNTKILVKALIISRLDYCNSLMLGISKYNLDK